MKKTLFFILCIASLFSNAQTCTPALATGGDGNMDFTVNNPFDFNSGGALGISPYWQPKCSVDQVQMKGVYNYTDNRKIRVSFELWYEEYSCGGTPIGSPTFITSTDLETYNAGSSINFFFIENFDSSKNISYKVRMKYKKKLGFGWGGWNYLWSNKIAIIPTDSTPNPNGYFSSVLSTEWRTSTGTGYNVNVNQLDINGSLNFNASPTSCEARWKYEISEFDLNAWSSSNTMSSPWIPGEAGYINMETFYTLGLEQNKLYQLKLIAGSGWHEKYFYFEIKGAVLEGTIATSGNKEIIVVDGNSYVIHRKCAQYAVNLNTTGTESVDKYRVRVGPVTPSLTPFGTEKTTYIQDGPVPLEVNLNGLYEAPFILGQIYRVVYEVTAPGDTEIYYFKTVSCTPGDFKQASLESIKNNSLDIKIYPNPVKDYFNINIEDFKTTEETSVKILSSTGDVIFESILTSNNLRINASRWKTGLYFCKIMIDGKEYLKKIIIE